MSMTTASHLMSPAAMLAVALGFTGLYVLAGMWAFVYANPDHRARIAATAWKMDPWWPFRAAHFQPAGARLCGLGRALFVMMLITYASWLSLAYKAIWAAH
jgi:hypothetical protein